MKSRPHRVYQYHAVEREVSEQAWSAEDTLLLLPLPF